MVMPRGRFDLEQLGAGNDQVPMTNGPFDPPKVRQRGL
jgi:hypothetical protein